MKAKKKTAWLLSLALTVATVLSGTTMQVRATTTNVSFTLGVTIAEGSNLSEDLNCSVAYQVVDSNGENVEGGGYGGYVDMSETSSTPVSLTDIDDSYLIKFTVQSAGLSIRLDGNDVTEEGWDAGKTVPVNEVNGKSYIFELFQRDSGGDQPQGRTYEIDFTDGVVSGNTVSYTVSDATVTLTSSVAISENKAIVGDNDVFTLSENFNSDTMEVLVYADDGFNTTLAVAEGKTSLANKTNDGGLPDNLKLKIQEKGQGGTGGDGGDGSGDGDDTGETFDGIAYFVWKGANDALCVHKITGLEQSRSQGQIIAFDIIYIPVSTVKDDTTGEQFVIGNENYFWAWSSAEEFISKNNSSYSAFADAVENIRDGEEKRSILIDPCGSVDGKSTVCTNGDRNFRATIYDDNTYEGVGFSQNGGDYTYFPNFWDNVFFTNTVDISGTTAENPAIYESFLLESTIHFGMAPNSVNAFTGIRALNVTDGAVTITGDASKGYNIKFGSNFFDNVVFEIATANGNYYLEIVRTAVKVRDNFGPGNTDDMVFANVFYDEKGSYSDYEVYATIHYKDGSTAMKKLTVSEITDDGFGNPVAPGTYEMTGGKGLKCANYGTTVSGEIVGIDFNAVKSGSLSGDSYSGSYFGSEKGVYYDIETRKVIY